MWTDDYSPRIREWMTNQRNYPSLTWWPNELIRVTYRNVDKGLLTRTSVSQRQFIHKKLISTSALGKLSQLEVSPILPGSFSREPLLSWNGSWLIWIWGQRSWVLWVLYISQFPMLKFHEFLSLLIFLSFLNVKLPFSFRRQCFYSNEIDL